MGRLQQRSACWMLMRCFSSSAEFWDAFAVLNLRMPASDLERPEALTAPCSLVSLALCLGRCRASAAVRVGELARDLADNLDPGSRGRALHDAFPQLTRGVECRATAAGGVAG